jgi:CYTH domain-containing protein
MTDEQIIQKLGLGNLPQEVQTETISSINRVVELRVIESVNDLMTDEQKIELKTKLAEDPKSAWKWLGAEVTDVNKLYDSALSDYLDEKSKK